MYENNIYYNIKFISAEGSWIQGGSRIPGGTAAAGTVAGGNIPVGQGPPSGHLVGTLSSEQTESVAGVRPNLVPSPGMVTAQAGQFDPNRPPANQIGPDMSQFRGIIPPFVSF